MHSSYKVILHRGVEIASQTGHCLINLVNRGKLIRRNPPNGVILALKSTEKQTLSFQETT